MPKILISKTFSFFILNFVLSLTDGTTYQEKTMTRCEIIANQSVQEEITLLLEEKIPDILYTTVPLVTGRGKNSYKLGSTTWPETNFILITYVHDDKVKLIKAIIQAVKQKFAGEGIKLFCVKAVEE